MKPISFQDGIFKPISKDSLLTSQMESVSPFPTSPISITSCDSKFLGTLVFNHLPPSDHERQASQSTSSGLRRLHRGEAVVPQNFPSHFYSKHIPRDSQQSRQFCDTVGELT